MFQRSWSYVGVGLWLAASSGITADPVPPEPDPANPVNYIEWINQTFGGDIKDNAHDDYCRIYKQIEPFKGDWDEVLAGPWSDNREAAAWLTAHRKALMKFRRTSRKRECFAGLDPPRKVDDRRLSGLLMSAMLPGLRAHRDACRGLLADGYRAWAGGDAKRLPANALAALRSARHLDTSPVLITRLVGIACAARGYQALQGVLRFSDDPDGVAAELLPKLERVDPPWPTLGRTYLGERLFGWDICQRLFVPGREKDDWTLHEPLLRQLQALGARRIAPEEVARIGYDTTLAEFNAYYDAVDDWTRTPYHVAASRAGRFGRMVAQCKSPLVQTLVPSLTRSRVLWERITAERRATHLMFHLFAHHGRAGQFPEMLDELDASDLSQLRVDPFSGGDLVYRRTADGFTLHSVAENLTDNGGRHDPKWGEDGHGDFIFWPVDTTQ